MIIIVMHTLTPPRVHYFVARNKISLESKLEHRGDVTEASSESMESRRSSVSKDLQASWKREIFHFYTE